jgi:hypothetical protein
MTLSRALTRGAWLGVVAGREVGAGLLRHLVLWGDGERVVPYLVPGFDIASGRAPASSSARVDLS